MKVLDKSMEVKEHAGGRSKVKERQPYLRRQNPASNQAMLKIHRMLTASPPPRAPGDLRYNQLEYNKL